MTSFHFISRNNTVKMQSVAGGIDFKPQEPVVVCAFLPAGLFFKRLAGSASHAWVDSWQVIFNPCYLVLP